MPSQKIKQAIKYSGNADFFSSVKCIYKNTHIRLKSIYEKKKCVVYKISLLLLVIQPINTKIHNICNIQIIIHLHNDISK